MPIEITMPCLSAEATEGIVVEWRLQQGQPVERGQVVAEVETDKAVVELEAPEAGILAFQAAGVGESVPAGALVAVLAGEGEDLEEVRKRYAGKTGAKCVSRPGVRAGPTSCPAGVLRAVPLRGTRGVTAARMLRSKREIPQYHVTTDCNADGIMAARKALKKNRRMRDVNMNAIILKCLAPALKRHPMLNATVVDDVIYQYAEFNIGVAVSLPDGVVAPVVRDVAGKSLARISAELDELAEAARSRKLRPEQFRGGTFTVSTLGSYGVHHFTAIVVPPQAAILAIGAVRAEAVVRDGEVVPGSRIAMTLSADHRAVDGAVAADFLRTLQSVLEDPVPFLS